MAFKIGGFGGSNSDKKEIMPVYEPGQETIISHRCRIIPFHPKQSPFDRINKGLSLVCVVLNFACVTAGLLSLGYVLWCS